jgi:predicted 2-oxoglutarate/Fe(II)-dependent dioxygenase YbiX
VSESPGEEAEEGAGPQRGERATDFVLPLEPEGLQTSFYALAGGKPSLLVFLGEESSARLCKGIEQLGEVEVFGVRCDGAPSEALPFPVFQDQKRAVASAYRLGHVRRSLILVLDANLRVVGSARAADAMQADDDAWSALGPLLAETRMETESIEIHRQAPVLLIPHVLDRQICDFLVQVWENQGNEETGVEQSHGETRQASVDHQNKSRRDHVVADDKLMKMLSGTIGRRVMPELQRAFAYRASRFEGFKIACYDAVDRGFFHAHRDNLSPTTAHRKFALTINLNGGYDGGHLRFPEFGPHLYRPEPGGAVVFSCSHLHEVTPVTDGRRFSLLSFLFSGDEASARSQ